MTRIRRTVAGLLLAALVLVPVTGCQRKVEVETGERVLCTYGHTVTDTVKTIEVPAKDASQYTVATRTITCDAHLQAEKLYAEAQDAIEADDLKAAEKALSAVIALDPEFRKAGEQLEAIDAGEKPTVDRDTSTPGDTTEQPTDPGEGEGEEEVTGPIASLAGWMPNDLAGFKADEIVADVLSISREYVGSKDSGRVLVIAAEQVLSDKDAESKVAQLKRSYERDGSSDKIGGNTAYAGSDGRSVAVVGIADGPVFIVLQLSDDSAKSSALVSALVDIAEGLPK